jgi:hypothetical protein
MGQKSWWLGSAVLAIATFAGGMGLGYLWRPKPDAGQRGAGAPDNQGAKSEAPAPPPDGIRLERFKDPEGLLEPFKDTIFVRKLSGNRYVKLWGEVETSGKTRFVMEVTSVPLVEFAGPVKHYEGKFTWLRRPTESPIKQAWSMTVETKNSSSFANSEAWLFDPGTTAIKSLRELPTPVPDLPDPLPIDRPVILHQSRFLCEFDDRFQAGSDVGMLASEAPGHPMAAVTSLVVPRIGCVSTVRLMCKVEPDIAVPGK